VLNEPAAHTPHERSCVEVPSRPTNCPAGHLRHSVHDAALFVVLNEPMGQGLQTRLVNAEPSILANWPVPQTIQPTHGLAGLRSWSHVPLPHASAGESVPAQYSPALHAVQVAGMPGPPAETCLVPAAHEP
jgi:hypothetical protein